ncbi:MAG: M3 family oligoendopeptidase, partial [Clostridia bacterium]|nr:M3 family oligoendopeptidase [Clostridia bacterium]
MTKFCDMKYERPDLEQVKAELRSFIERFSSAKNFDEAKAVFLEKEEAEKHISTTINLAHIRNSINTKDEFYDAEMKFWHKAMPELQEVDQEFALAMLKSPFRAQFEAEYGNLIFLNAEIELKTFSPENIPLMQEENELVQEYENLLASSEIPFEGKTYTISQIGPHKTDADDARRLAAWRAEGKWYKENQAKLDELYDKLTHLRDEMGRRLGYDGYTELGYYRMGRNCYTKDDVKRFREAVVKYIVPLAEKVYRAQAKRLGKEYPMSFADCALSFRSGNPRPKGDAEDILRAADRFYDALSPETSEFFRTMRECGLLDVLATDGKRAGGYCTEIPDYEVPFIFANFNGTSGDVETVTHEAGHAFESWLNIKRVPQCYVWPTLEACEVHSMSMEFFAWRASEDFFGDDARKFRYSHLAGSLTFIPYGTMVDHFQHEVYENPSWTPRERHDCWKKLLGVYMPWLRLDGDIPFYADGEGWQRQHHIYSMPFYYIDYCLAQTVALEFWAMIREDYDDAWEHYMAYTKQG